MSRHSRRRSPAAQLARHRTVARQEARQEALREAQQLIQTTLLHHKRRLEAGQGHRFSGDRWGSADADSLQADLVADLDTTRRRCRHEMENNGIVKGIVKSFADDLVGAQGPKLQLLSNDKAWSDEAEHMWREWWATADLNGRYAGPELLHLGARGMWGDGEWFWQFADAGTGGGPIRLRLHAHAARHIDTPFNLAGNASITKGVELTQTGGVRRYHRRICDVQTGLPLESEPVDAADMVHFFIPEEIDQYRGCPLLASSLTVIGQLRDYDREVMEAARMAAMLGLVLTTSNTEGEQIELTPGGDAWELEHGMAVPLPPGYEAKQINPQQPMRIYKEFRNEKLMEIGRSVCMPLMIVRQDSSNHNYSSARFDGQGYDRGLAAVQGQIERMALNRILARVLREGFLARQIGLTPRDLSVSWVWPKRPHVDPVKEKTGAVLRLLDGTSSQGDECAELGKDLDAVRAQRAKEGLPEGPIALNGITLSDILAIAAEEQGSDSPSREEVTE